MKRNNYIDILKAVCVIFVLLYHLGLCSAGFLAVCVFFVISGFLFSVSLGREDFSLGRYYLKRLKALYLPLAIVVLTTVLVFRYFIDLPWVTIKQETLSTLLGYHNFHQIASSSNYFMREDQSPFTHMWYIAILLQFEFILPLLCLPLKKGKIRNILLYLLTTVSVGLFALCDMKEGISVSYYHTLSRMFSFFLGCCSYHINFRKTHSVYLYGILALLISSFCCGSYSEKYYVTLMTAVSVLTSLFLIISKNHECRSLKTVSLLCDISYPVYLVQFPVIYIFGSLSELDNTQNLIIEAAATIIISAVITYAVKTDKESGFFRKLVLVVLILISAAGLYGYISCPDYYKEMEELNAQLEESKQSLIESQNEYLKKIEAQKAELNSNLESLENAIENIDETVANTQLCLIGDSVMLGGSYRMDETFNNYYCDAEVSRGGYLTSDVLQQMMDGGLLGDYLIIHMGTNWGLKLDEVEEVNAMLEGTGVRIFWITVTNGWKGAENPMLTEYCATHDNNYLIDWYTYSRGHDDWFSPDGIHLRVPGQRQYNKFIFNTIKPVILEDLENKITETQQSFEDQVNSTISLYGDKILSELYGLLDESYTFHLCSDQNFETIYSEIAEDKENDTLSKNVLIVLSSSMTLTDDQQKSLISLLEGTNYHVFLYGESSSDNFTDLSILFSREHYAADNVLLSEEGKALLSGEIKKIFR